MKNFIINVVQGGHYQELYEMVQRSEEETKKLLITFQKEYPGILKQENVDEITSNLDKKEDKESILKRLKNGDKK